MNRKIEKLHDLLNDIEQAIPFNDKVVPKVSKVSIGWQLDHVLKVINAVCPMLAKKHSRPYKKDFNFMRLLLFPLGYIPRGRARAPKVVNNREAISTKDLEAQLNSAKNHVNGIENIHEGAYFIHHIFGTLSKKQTLRFLEIHTRHHLKIVEDILKS